MKGKEGLANTPTISSLEAPDMSGLTIEKPQPKRAAPPRPPSMSKPRQPPPPPQPPRPAARPPSVVEEVKADDENDPFGDQNVIETPAIERSEPDW